jgi:hypothetical protein
MAGVFGIGLYYKGVALSVVGIKTVAAIWLVVGTSGENQYVMVAYKLRYLIV